MMELCIEEKYSRMLVLQCKGSTSPQLSSGRNDIMEGYLVLQFCVMFCQPFSITFVDGWLLL